MPQKIEISHKTILFTIFLLIGLWFLYYIKDILFLIFVAFLISIILNPSVDKLQKLKIPRGLAAIIVYLFFAIILFFSIGIILKPFIEQSKNFATNLPLYLSRFQIPVFITDKITREIGAQISALTSQFLKIGISIISNILAVIAVFVFALYFVVARKRLPDYLSLFLSKAQIERLEKLLMNLENKVGGWARAQILLMLVVGFLNYLGLSILGIPYAIPLGVLAGLLEVIPNLGPIIAAIPAVVVGFGISPVTGLSVIALVFLIQQIENYLLVPKVMEKSAGVNPLVTLLVILIGFRIAGVIGALLSIPVIVILREIVKEYLLERRI